MIWLPRSVLCYTPPTRYPAIGPLPFSQSKTITFGSFNASLKVNNYTVALWAQGLRQVPGSCLLLKFNGSREDIIQRYRRQFVELGIETARVRILPREPSHWHHLDLYNQVDIGLDTYPFNGCVNTLESLWMGVPVISLCGERYIARMGATILNNIGLTSCVASNPEQFVAKAAALAQHPAALARIRMGLRPRMLQSPIGDARIYARNLEEAYVEMWQRWCASQTQMPERSSHPCAQVHIELVENHGATEQRTHSH